ncbi:sensor histidine kinase [Blautia sp. MSJ-9]|uniref:sensor histidine kinase n=1 Tax=Blautia sp. MSJ-9 TaxID=2841511 RepID=UPI001C0FFD30|nr:GHKL domain-containing protein [Blautia sp. MSJ-9]MBU5680905.1 GHKL domain-containing protein [Blautia sp. MSJ-9]
MLVQILSAIHGITTMLFGIYCSAFFLGVKPNRKNIMTLFLLFSGQGCLYIIDFLLFGETLANMSYPLIVHFPLILFLTYHYKYPLISSAISVFSAYLCCQISNWVGLFALAVTGAQWCYYFVRILTTVTTFVILFKYVFRSTKTIFAKNARELSIIGFLPFVYYIFDYTSTKFSHLLYSGNKAVVEFMGFAFCIAYLVFLMIYFREYENKQELKQYSDLREIQIQSMQKEIEQVKISSQKLAILRHDMRHQLNIILTQLQNDHPDKAQEYIHEISSAYDDTIIASYSRNEMLNSVLSIYHSRFTDKGFSLNCNVSTGKDLPCPDLAICTILSNALENSMHALENLESSSKWAKLTLSQKKNHLLFQLENPVEKIPEFVDGVPVSNRNGHGIGVKSIIYYVDQLNGQCHFSITDHCFVLRIII